MRSRRCATCLASGRSPPRAAGRACTSRQSLTEVKEIKNHFGVTVNDVVVAICAGALRSLIDARGELPDEPLLAIVPMSVRTPEERGTFGNRVASMLAPLPTHFADPEQRLHAAHDAMRAAKEHHGAVPATLLQDANDVILPALFGRAVGATVTVAARMPGQAAVNTVVSIVPGSPVPVDLAGARLEALYPVSAVIHGVAMNLTVISYRDGLCFRGLRPRQHRRRLAACGGTARGAGRAAARCSSATPGRARRSGSLSPSERTTGSPRRPRTA